MEGLMIPNLGRVLTVLAKAEAQEILLHDSVTAWGAPSECHGLVRKGEARRRRTARRHAEALARRPLRTILREAEKRGLRNGMYGRTWDRVLGRFLVGRVY